MRIQLTISLSVLPPLYSCFYPFLLVALKDMLNNKLYLLEEKESWESSDSESFSQLFVFSGVNLSNVIGRVVLG